MKDNIVLVGLMGTGKTTISKVLASKLGWKRVDTDDLIVEHEGKSIPAIFEHEGELYFRQMEEKMLKETMQGSKQVIATGGGAVLSPLNREHMLHNGYVVSLRASVDTIIERVKHDRNRPLLQGELRQRVTDIMEKRKHAYDFANIQIDTDHLKVEDIVTLIIQQWEKA